MMWFTDDLAFGTVEADMKRIESLAQLEAIYGRPGEASLVKETDHVTEHYRRMIEASPFCVLATAGPQGLDCTPRGDVAGFVRVADPRTLLMPDRRGNNRTDSLRNILVDPRVALLFLLPGHGNCLRVNGTAEIGIDSDLLESFAVDGKQPRSVLVIHVEAVYFQCARAIQRAGLWDAAGHIEKAALPTAGEILAELSAGHVGGKAYDEDGLTAPARRCGSPAASGEPQCIAVAASA